MLREINGMTQETVRARGHAPLQIPQVGGR